MTFSIRTYLLLLVAALAIPLAGAVGYGIYRDMQSTVAQTKTSMRILVTVVAKNADSKIANARATLERLAARPLVKEVDENRCDPVLKELHVLYPGYSNIVYTDMRGRAVCSAITQPGGKPVNVGQTPWFRRVALERRFSVGQPHIGPITGKWVSVLSAPIWNDHHEMVGAVHLPLDLSAFDPQIPNQYQPPNSHYGFFNEDGLLIWRNVDAERFIGKRPESESARLIVQTRDGEFESLSSDSVERFFSVAPVPEAGWIAFVGVPTSAIYAEAKQRAMTSAALGLLGLATITFLATLLARRIQLPINSLATASRAIRQGNPGARALPGGPVELVTVAEEFNAMVEGRLRGEARLRESEERLRAFLDNSAVIAWLKDEDGRFVFLSENFQKRFKLSIEMARGKQDSDLWPQPIAEEFRRNDLSVLARGSAAEFVEATTNPDGSLSWWLSNKFVFQSAGGKRYVGGVAVDITERKRAEAVVQSERDRSQLYLNTVQAIMVALDTQGRITMINVFGCALLDYKADELVGQDWFATCLPKNHESVFTYYQQLTRGEIHHQEYFENEIISATGRRILVAWHNALLRDDSGRIIGTLSAGEDITERRAAEEEIHSLAFFDPLTGLPNRRLLLNRLEHSMAASVRSFKYRALLFLDLDQFKTLNDTLGHDMGDKLLVETARRLESSIREGDTVSRLGGDEFVVLLEQLSPDLEEAGRQTGAVAEKILEKLNQPCSLGKETYRGTASIGVTLFIGHEVSVDEVLKRADLAMYQAKSAGRDTMRFFDPAMQAAIATRASLEKDLRQAVEREEFVLYYQPQIDASGRCTGVEALIRWNSPDRGFVSPAEFIPLAEETGLIIAIGWWVLREACRQLVAWQNHPAAAGMTVAVNVSAKQFKDPDFVPALGELIRISGAAPQRLKLEITESILMEHVDDAVARMLDLKASGISFSLDDFGTGYSSLSYVKRLPLDQLKIDQSFVRDILIDQNDAAICRAIIALGGSLGLNIIAEGVETSSQWDFLAAEGCNGAQGYLYAKPMPAPNLLAWLEERS